MTTIIIRHMSIMATSRSREYKQPRLILRCSPTLSILSSSQLHQIFTSKNSIYRYDFCFGI